MLLALIQLLFKFDDIFFSLISEDGQNGSAKEESSNGTISKPKKD